MPTMVDVATADADETSPPEAATLSQATALAQQKKVAVLRTKLSMAKEMLEELLAERDVLEKAHAEEVRKRKAKIAAGEEERATLRAELTALKKAIADRESRGASAEQQATATLSKVTLDDDVWRDEERPDQYPRTP